MTYPTKLELSEERLRGQMIVSTFAFGAKEVAEWFARCESDAKRLNERILELRAENIDLRKQLELAKAHS